MQELLNAAQKAEDLTDEAAEQFYTYAYAQYKFGHPSQAVEVFRILSARRPLEGRFWFGLGACCQEMNDYEGAMRAWAMAAIIDFRDPYPHFHAAECAISLSNLADARLAIQEVKKRIDESHPLNERVRVLYDRSN